MSTSGINTLSEREEYWDFENLESPQPDLAPARQDLCNIGLTCSFAIEDDPKVGCAMTVVDDSTVVYDSYAGVERRGRSSLKYDKPNYGLELRQEDGITNNPTNLLGMGKDEDWILDGSWVDRSFARNQLVSDLFTEMDDSHYAPEGRFCTLQLNGEPQGIYRLLERPKRDDDRASFDADDGSGRSFMIRQSDDGPLRFRLGLQNNWQLSYPNKRSASDDQKNAIQDWLNELSNMLHADEPTDEGGTIFDYLNEQSVVDWILLQEFAKNVDAYKLSVYLYKDATSTARLVPWDFDLSFGQPTVRSWDADGPTTWIGERTQFFEALLKWPNLGSLLSERWLQLRREAFSEDHIFELLDAYEQALTEGLEENFEIWPLENVNFRSIYPPYRLYEVESHQAEMERLRQWISRRLQWMDDNIDQYIQATPGG